MKEVVKEKTSPRSDREKRMGAREKTAYATPVLRVYGSVGELTQKTGTSGDACASRKGACSEPRVKENIVRIGTHPLGIGLYLFDYRPEYCERWGHGRQFGVMIDELEPVMPEAVTLHADGYKTVDYGMLGIRRNLH